MRIALAFLNALFAGEALACGYCVEDKIAAVYDHAAVSEAAARRQSVAYFAIDGGIRGTREHLLKTVASVPAVQKGSARVSVESGSLAIVFDPRRASLAVVQRALEERLRPLGLSLLLLDTR